MPKSNYDNGKYRKYLKIKKSKKKCSNKSVYSKKSHKLKGGDKIGEGSFGCVITPPIPCKDNSIKNNKSYVSKIIKANNKRDYDDTMHEILLGSLFKKIDPDSKYFTFIFDYCQIKKPISRPDFKTLKSGQAISNKVTKNKQFCYTTEKDKTYNLIQKNAGLNLDDVLVYSKYKSERSIIKSRMKSIVRHMIIGLRKCHKIDIINHDIKADNMGIRIENNNPYVTYFDFGLSEDIRKLDTSSYEEISTSVYGTPGYISPDMYVLSKLVKTLYKEEFSSLVSGANRKRLINKIYQEIKEDEDSIHIKKLGLYKSTLKIPSVKDSGYKSNKSSNKINSLSDNSSNNSSTNSSIKSTTKSTSENKEALVSYQETKELYDLFIKLIYKNELLPKFYKKFNGIKHKYDVYALGITFFKISKFSGFEQSDTFLDLLRNMLHYNPLKRFDINQCLNHPFISPNKT